MGIPLPLAEPAMSVRSSPGGVALETGEAGGVIERGRVGAGARECYRDEEGGEEAAHSGGAAVVLSLLHGRFENAGGSSRAHKKTDRRAER